MRLHRLDVVFMITRAPTRLVRESRSFRDGAVPTQAQGKLTVAVAAGMAVRRERKDAENVLRREQREHRACKPAIGRASFLRDVRIASLRYGTPEARQAHRDGREANDLRGEASSLRREVLDLGRSLIAIHDRAEVLWTRIRDLAPPAAGWWASAFKLLDPESPEAKVSSEETTTLAETRVDIICVDGVGGRRSTPSMRSSLLAE